MSGIRNSAFQLYCACTEKAAGLHNKCRWSRFPLLLCRFEGGRIPPLRILCHQQCTLPCQPLAMHFLLQQKSRKDEKAALDSNSRFVALRLSGLLVCNKLLKMQYWIISNIIEVMFYFSCLYKSLVPIFRFVVLKDETNLRASVMSFIPRTLSQPPTSLYKLPHTSQHYNNIMIHSFYSLNFRHTISGFWNLNS